MASHQYFFNDSESLLKEPVSVPSGLKNHQLLSNAVTVHVKLSRNSDVRLRDLSGLERPEAKTWFAHFSNGKIRFQSFFMLITVQPFLFASAIKASEKVPTWVSGRPPAGP
jgi:hypothetical protein